MLHEALHIHLKMQLSDVFGHVAESTPATTSQPHTFGSNSFGSKGSSSGFLKPSALLLQSERNRDSPVPDSPGEVVLLSLWLLLELCKLTGLLFHLALLGTVQLHLM